MLNKIISNYALSELLEVEGNSLAISDKDGIILWFNKSFKEETNFPKIKGRTFFELFDIKNEDDVAALEKHKTLLITSVYHNKNLSIIPLTNKNRLDGYLLRIFSPPVKRTLSEKHENVLQRNVEINKELHDVISLFGKESSLEVLSKEILLRCIKITNSKLGFVKSYVTDEGEEFLSYDTNDEFDFNDEIKREIKTSFTFLTKWLNVNKKTLIITAAPNSIGFNLAHVLQSEYLLIAPCFYENKLIAAIVLGTKGKKYSHFEVNFIEQFSSLLAFTISGLKAIKLNAVLRDKLEQGQKLETIGKLSSGLAHDFNNLLTSIFASLNLLKKRVPQAENVIRLIDNIENCSVRARDLTKGLLSFGKPTPKQKELIKPNLLIAEIVKIVNQTFPKEIAFESHIEEKLNNILGNPTEIYQVLLNLCVNAKEAIKNTGKIILSANNILIDEKNISDFPRLDVGKYVHFSVTDTGEGISEDNLNKIFDPFFSTKKKETGSGLGLYVTQGIVKAHNGFIDVTSEMNKGTTFNIYIPVYEPIAQQTASKPSERIILVADDEIMLRDLLAELLESNGFNVIRVASGEEVLKVLTEEMIVDLLIIDYNMPGMNGLECIEQVRKLNYKMPVVLSSGSLSLEEGANLERFGITSLVTKPYDFDTMLSTIRSLV